MKRKSGKNTKPVSNKLFEIIIRDNIFCDILLFSNYLVILLRQLFQQQVLLPHHLLQLIFHDKKLMVAKNGVHWHQLYFVLLQPIDCLFRHRRQALYTKITIIYILHKDLEAE